MRARPSAIEDFVCGWWAGHDEDNYNEVIKRPQVLHVLERCKRSRGGWWAARLCRSIEFLGPTSLREFCGLLGEHHMGSWALRAALHAKAMINCWVSCYLWELYCGQLQAYRFFASVVMHPAQGAQSAFRALHVQQAIVFWRSVSRYHTTDLLRCQFRRKKIRRAVCQALEAIAQVYIEICWTTWSLITYYTLYGSYCAIFVSTMMLFCWTWSLSAHISDLDTRYCNYNAANS